MDDLRRTSMDDLLKMALFRVIDRLSAEAASDSLYGDDLPQSDEDDRLGRPILFDPRFDLTGEPPFVIDETSRELGRLGDPKDLRNLVHSAGLDSQLEDAQTLGEYLGVLNQSLTSEGTL